MVNYSFSLHKFKRWTIGKTHSTYEHCLFFCLLANFVSKCEIVCVIIYLIHKGNVILCKEYVWPNEKGDVSFVLIPAMFQLSYKSLDRTMGAISTIFIYIVRDFDIENAGNIYLMFDTQLWPTVFYKLHIDVIKLCIIEIDTVTKQEKVLFL